MKSQGGMEFIHNDETKMVWGMGYKCYVWETEENEY